jgi:hypothetical protein
MCSVYKVLFLFTFSDKIIVGRSNICAPNHIFDEVRWELLEQHFVTFFEILKHVVIQTLDIIKYQIIYEFESFQF